MQMDSYMEDLRKVEEVEEEMIRGYIEETLAHKQLQYTNAMREIDAKSYSQSSLQNYSSSRPTVSQDASRPSYTDSIKSKSYQFDISDSEGSKGHDAKWEIDRQNINSFYDKLRDRVDKIMRKEDKEEVLHHQFHGSRLDQKFNDFALKSSSLSYQEREKQQIQKIKNNVNSMIQSRVRNVMLMQSKSQPHGKFKVLQN